MKTKSQILTAAGGSHEAAFDALYADYAASITANGQLQEQLDSAGNDSNSIRTRVIAKALAPLAEALGIELPPAGQKPPKDAEQQIAEQIEHVVNELDAVEVARDTALELLGEAGLDIDALQSAETDDAAEAIVAPWLQQLGQTAELERTIAVQRAASAANVTEADLTEWLGGRPLVSGKVKDGEGKDMDAYGLTVRGEDGKDAFKPLNEFGTFQKLAGGSQSQQRQEQQFVRQRTQQQQTQQISTADRAAQIAAEGRGTI